jgi:hypothetical protein
LYFAQHSEMLPCAFIRANLRIRLKLKEINQFFIFASLNFLHNPLETVLSEAKRRYLPDAHTVSWYVVYPVEFLKGQKIQLNLP